VVDLSEITQKIELLPDPITTEDFHVEIPKKGKIKPSVEKKAYSGVLRVQTLYIFTTSNYTPGKLVLGTPEEK